MSSNSQSHCPPASMGANHYRFCSISLEHHIRSWLLAVPSNPTKLDPVLEPLQEYEMSEEVRKPDGLQTWPDLPQWGRPGSPRQYEAAFKLFQETIPKSPGIVDQAAAGNESVEQLRQQLTAKLEAAAAKLAKQPVRRP